MLNDAMFFPTSAGSPGREDATFNEMALCLLIIQFYPINPVDPI